ncbi:MAG: TonB-dependent receptor plug domain-containing protein [Melioribacteraceae bacterium]|nr:TonB-dependent receptor plug domain-containing protein [Melioribacteraceae bacterium]
MHCKICSRSIGILIVTLVLTNATLIYSQGNESFQDLSLEELLNIELNVASTNASDIFSTPSSVSGINQEMIREFNITSISEAIDLIPGFNNSRTYLKRNVPTARGILQDHYASKVLVMINGNPTWHAGTGEANLDRVDINDVERIEVLRGPASVLYGTNAFSGAINIVLKDKTNPSMHFGVGERGFLSAGGNYSFNNEDYSLFLSANNTSERGHDYEFTDEKGGISNVKEYLRSRNFNLSLNSMNHSVLFNIYDVDESYLGVTPTFLAGAGKNTEVNGYILKYGYANKISDILEIRGKASYDYNRRDISRTADDVTRAEVEGYRWTAALKLLLNPLEDLHLEVGGDYETRVSEQYSNYNSLTGEELVNNGLKDKSVSEFSLLGQATYSHGSFIVTGGMRYTSNEFFGSNISSRGTIVYKLTDKNSFKFIYGTSYRAP